jgi:hypothetical protein
MNKKEYSSRIKRVPYYYLYSKKIGQYILDGKDRNEITKKCVDENKLLIPSIVRRKEITNIICERLFSLDKNLLNSFCNGDIITSKFVLLYAVAKTDKLFYEFVLDCSRDALKSFKPYISVDDFKVYVSKKRESDPIVRKWTDITLYGLGQGYKRILTESGLYLIQGKNLVIQKLIIEPAIKKYITMQDSAFIDSTIGGK